VLSFSNDGKSIWYAGYGDDGLSWNAVANAGGPARRIASMGENSIGVIPSPDGRHMLVIGRDMEAWMIAIPADTTPLKTDFSDSKLERITSTGADYVSWESDSTVVYAFRNDIYRYTVGRGAPKLVHTVKLEQPRHQGEGVTAFTNARIITLSGERGPGDVIEKGTIVVRGRRIEAVGSADKVKVPEGAKVIDATGLTIMPSLADVHWHPDWGQEVGVMDSPKAPAYGVTTVWIPGPPSWNRGFLPIEELRETGRIIGPRWGIAGPVINVISNGEPSARMLGSYDDALRMVKHHADAGATVMKEYLTRRRDFRRWFARAARETGIGVVSHAQGIEEVLKDAIDGYTGVDHLPFAVPVYDDVRQFLARTGLVWTPNFFVTGWGVERGGSERITFMSQLLKRWPEQRDKWTYYYAGDPRMDTPYPGEDKGEFRVTRAARAAAYLIAGGANIAISYHNPPGLMTHAEMWLLQHGGAPAGEALRAGARNGVVKMGWGEDLGSLEPGKIADFLVLKGNPLEDVINTLAQKYVVMDGVIQEVDSTSRH
jgi:imidazolonepropionase-like amidohydrolase